MEFKIKKRAINEMYGDDDLFNQEGEEAMNPDDFETEDAIDEMVEKIMDDPIVKQMSEKDLLKMLNKIKSYGVPYKNFGG